MISIHSRRVMRAMPPGLANPVAVFASSLVSPIPTAHRSPVAANTVACSWRAKPSGSSVFTPTNASSQPHTSTTAPSDRNAAITRSEAASYAGRSIGRNTAPGHLRAAVLSGIPDRTPNARASYDAVATTCRARAGSPSPPTTTGRPASSGRRRTSTAARN